MSIKLEVAIEPAVYGPGDVVRGDVVVVRGGKARGLRVSLVYRERSPHYSHPAVEVPGPVHTGDLEAGQRVEFAITLPADALPSQRLPHGETCWEVWAKCNRPGFDVDAIARLDDAAPRAEADDEGAPAHVATDESGRPLVDPAWVKRERGA